MQLPNSLISQKEEIFETSLSDISNIEEDPESSEALPEIANFINASEQLEKEDINLTQFNISIQEDDQKDLKEDIHPIVRKGIKTSDKRKAKIKNEKKEKIKDFLKSIKNLENKILRYYGYKRRISLSKLNKFLEKYTLKEIEHLTIEKVLKAISPKNAEIIRYFKIQEKIKGKTAFKKINRLKFKAMYEYYKQDCKCIISGKHIYNLAGKFRTLKDVLKEKIKKLRKKKLKIAKKEKINDEFGEKPMEIEQEVCSMFIDLKKQFYLDRAFAKFIILLFN